MKNLARGAAILSFSLIVASCSKKEATVTETNPPSGDQGAVASADGGTGAGGAAGSPKAASIGGDDNALLVGLSADDRTKFEAWFKRHNLTSDPEVMDRDDDGDGYSNREEFLADTNPRDGKSLPGVMEAASVKAVNEITVPLILREVKGGKARVQRTDTGGEEELTSGAQPKGLPYKVTGVKHEVKADKHGVFTDVSNVTLENVGTKETVTLIRDLPARSSDTHAVVVGPNGEEKKVHLDETVEIPGMPGRQFKVIELRADQVLVEELGTKRALSIPKR
jgi:hypothetical protein